MSAPVRPASASDFVTNLVALTFGLAVLWWAQTYNPTTLLSNAVMACVLTATVIALSDFFRFRVHRRPSTQLDWNAGRRADPLRVGVKLVGFAFTLAVIALAYWVFPEYHGDFYNPYWALLKTYGVWALIATPCYFWLLDGALKDPYDSYWQVGMLLAGRRPSSWTVIAQHFAGWTVKAFFLPLMTVYLTQELLTTHSWWLKVKVGAGFMVWYDFIYNTTFLIDLMFCVIGYCATLRIFDSHIRSTEPTAGGWLVALLCYQPFYSIFESQYLRYEDGKFWSGWLAPLPWLHTTWACVIMFLLVVYALATVSFGLRFSNLTHRGIITGGPYKFTKHPAYIAKNLSWWLISIPFISAQGWAALDNCLALGLLNLVYFLRAKTEERHLSRDPEYVAYALWMNEHGLFKRIGLWIPALRYRSP